MGNNDKYKTNRNKYKTPETLQDIKSNWGEEKQIEFKKIMDEFTKKGLQYVLIDGYGWKDEEIKTIATIYGEFTEEALAIVFVELGDITTYLKVMDYITIQYYGLNFNNVDTNYKSEAYKIKK